MEASPGNWDLESFDDFAVWGTALSLVPKTKPVRRALALLNELSSTVLRISGMPLDDLVDIPSSSTPATIPPSSIDDGLFSPSPVDPPVSLPVAEAASSRPRPRLKTRSGGSNIGFSSNPAASSPGVAPGSAVSTSPTSSSRIKSKPGTDAKMPQEGYSPNLVPPVCCYRFCSNLCSFCLTGL
jgi:hypothetical protein